MKKVTSLHDSKINKAYDVYTVNAREFVHLVQQVYEAQNMSPWFVQRFNEELKVGSYGRRYAERLTSAQRMRAGLEYRGPHDERDLENYEQEVRNAEEAFYKGELLREGESRLGAIGYELMPFAISVQNQDVEGKMETLELLDGFRRIFYVHPNDVPDQEVLVKVYDTLHDADWVSSMMVFNSWKFADQRNALTFLDRGMKLGLYKRYGIDFTNMTYYGSHDYSRSVLKYVARNPHDTLWQNEQFAPDIRFIEQMKSHQPVFTLKKRKGEDQVFDASTKPYQLPYFLEAIHNKICTELGAFRREETKAILKGEELPRKRMNFEDYLEFLQEKELQKHFIKLSEMSVGGFIDNYIEKHLKIAIQLIVHPTLVSQ